MTTLPPTTAGAPGRGSRPPGGYTLLEILMVLAIMSLLVGAAVPMVTGFSREQRLRDVARELLIFAKTARTDAMTTGQATEVVFGAKAIGLRRPGDKEEPSETMQPPAGIKVTLRPFGEDKVQKRDGQRWIFQPTGLCEPLTIIITEGESYLEIDFDPLTAGISEERYYFP